MRIQDEKQLEKLIGETHFSMVAYIVVQGDFCLMIQTKEAYDHAKMILEPFENVKISLIGKVVSLIEE